MTIKQQGGIFGRNPSFNNVDSEALSVSGLTTLNGNLNVDNNTLKVNSANNRVGVGGVATPEDTFTVAGGARFGSSNTSSAYGQIALGRSGSSTGSHISSGTDGHIRFSNGSSLAGSATERLRILPTGDVKVNTGNLIIGTSGKGIDFSATAGTGTSELFSDYEQGVWTPVISDGTNNATSNVSVGTYTKTGDHVHVQGRIRLSSLGSVSGAIRLTGLPFNSKAVSNNFGAMTIGRATGLNITAGHVVVGDLRANVDYVSLNLWDSAVGNTSLQDTEFSADGDISFSMNYLSV